jgi:hypothetical protein
VVDSQDGFQHDAILVCTGVNDGETMSLTVNQGTALEGQLANATITFQDVNLATANNAKGPPQT